MINVKTLVVLLNFATNFVHKSHISAYSAHECQIWPMRSEHWITLLKFCQKFLNFHNPNYDIINVNFFWNTVNCDFYWWSWPWFGCFLNRDPWIFVHYLDVFTNGFCAQSSHSLPFLMELKMRSNTVFTKSYDKINVKKHGLFLVGPPPPTCQPLVIYRSIYQSIHS